MRFLETPLPGVIVIEPDRLSDERGWFARTFDRDEFRALGMNHEVIQTNASFNALAGTLRGMHYQAEPYGETKVVRCARGAIYDVAVDIRAGSPTNGRWHGVELSESNGIGFYIPAGFGHGFQTLVDGSEVHYLMGSEYVPDAARGVRWDDPAFGIQWPAAPPAGRVISERDACYPDHPQ
jgi:dTDP-4-dehydrorhamnose 3,5-epimerase